VLVLDDEALIRWAASTTLLDAGYEVVQASDIAAARKVAAETPFGLALLDARLPDGDGFALMHEIHSVQPACRFVMMTAFRTPELSAHAAADKVKVLDKPFGMPDLLHVVDSVLSTPPA
jgi:two-component system OmpR family response regulator